MNLELLQAGVRFVLHAAVLEYLASHGGSARLAALQAAMPVSQVSIWKALNALAKLGFVATEPDPGDRRRRLVALTKTGAGVASRWVSLDACGSGEPGKSCPAP